jgi:hypothetical protein
MLFRSDDDGRTWQYVCDLFPLFWPRLFLHRGQVYLMGCSTEYGDLLISRSDDGGMTFRQPTVLGRGSGRVEMPGMHRNPVPLLEYKGRLWTSCEWGCWSQRYHATMMLSCPLDADLTDASNWTFTEPLKYDPSWPGVAQGPSAGCIEGSAVIGPDGELYCMMRYDMVPCTPNYGRALLFHIDADHPDAPMELAQAVEFSANHSKFEVQYDPELDLYLTIASRIRGPENTRDRNLLSLFVSPDLVHWTLVCDLLDYTHCDPQQVGFQYVAYLREEKDLLYLIRTGINGAQNYHDSNCMLFRRLPDFRTVIREKLAACAES